MDICQNGISYEPQDTRMLYLFLVKVSCLVISHKVKLCTQCHSVPQFHEHGVVVEAVRCERLKTKKEPQASKPTTS